MKIVFMGTPDFAISSLQALAQSKHEVVLVVTGPDKPRGRGQRLLPTPVKKIAQSFDLPIYQPQRLKETGVVDTLKQFPADLFVVVAFRILPQEIIEIPARGVINLHASLLPKYRGAAPIQWALLNGEKETGVTTFFIEKNVDTGDIVLQRKVPIYDEDNAGDLHNRLAQEGARLVLETVTVIDKGDVPLTKQIGEISLAPKITREMTQVNWNKDAEKIVNQVRAFSPYPGAFTHWKQKLMKIYKAKVTNIDASESPGKIITRGEQLFVAAKNNLVEIQEIQEEGKKRMGTADFLRGKKKEDLIQFE